MSVVRNKFGRFEKIEQIDKANVKNNSVTPEIPSAEATLLFAKNLANVADTLATNAASKLSPLMKKVAASPTDGMDFNVEKYPVYFRDLCNQLNSIYCSIEQIATIIEAVDF